jgi:hypothetical protein
MGRDILSHVRILTSQRGGSRSTEHALHSHIQEGLVDEWSGEIAVLGDSITVKNAWSATVNIVLGQDKIRMRARRQARRVREKNGRPEAKMGIALKAKV